MNGSPSFLTNISSDNVKVHEFLTKIVVKVPNYILTMAYY